MSSLQSTTWKFNVSNTTTATFTFNANGTVSSYGVAFGQWAENAAGDFVVTVPIPSIGPNAVTVWTGKHANGAGTGIVSPVFNGIIFSFKMTKLAKTDADQDLDEVRAAVTQVAASQGEPVPAN